MSDKPDEISHKPDEISHNPDEISDNPDEMGDKPDEMSDKPDEMSDKPDEMSDNNERKINIFEHIIKKFNSSLQTYDEDEDLNKYNNFLNEIKEYLDNDERKFNTGNIRSLKNFLIVVSGYQAEYEKTITSKLYEKFKNFMDNNLDLLKEIAHENDTFGNPLKFNTILGMIEVNNLKYIMQSLYILNHLKLLNKKNVNFYEIGGGYGGLSFWIYKLAHLFNIEIDNYTLFDLKEAASLQNYYFNNFKINSKSFSEIMDINNENNNYNYLISNYAFSEIPAIYKTRYIEKLFPIINNGFITWNVHPLDLIYLKNLNLDNLNIFFEGIQPDSYFSDLIIQF